MNAEDMGVAHNIYHGALLTEAEDEDVIGYLDADDRLAPNALEEIDKEAYSQGYLVSYGSFKKKSTGKRCRACVPYPKGVNVRKHKYLAMHFRTMKYKVFKKIPKDYFMYKGKWLEAASDVALMMGAMQIAGLKNCKFIKKKIYFYRDNYSGTMNRKTQYRCEKKVRRKKPLRKVF
jgi:glycosyltransferase involved in cell wall biosynthesis